MLRKESVNKTVFDLISALQEKDCLKDFVLAGGTGLALIIGHRKSVGIDLFTSKDFVTEQLLEKKDFIDLYFLLTDHNYDVERLLSIYKTKYSHRNALHALKSLNYYEDVDLSDWPDLIKRKDTSWNEIMEAINRACEFYIGKITD